MRASLQKLAAAIFASILASLGFSGCETPGESALVGAAAGAVIGHHTGLGALRGAAIGAGTGYVAGRVAEHERRRAYEQGLADREGYYYDDARYYRRGRYYDDRGRVIIRERRYYVAPVYRERVYVY